MKFKALYLHEAPESPDATGNPNGDVATCHEFLSQIPNYAPLDGRRIEIHMIDTDGEPVIYEYKAQRGQWDTDNPSIREIIDDRIYSR